MITAKEEAITTKQQQTPKPLKQGHKCLGCLCDTKRSVVVIQLVFGIILNAVGIVVASLVGENEAPAYSIYDDDFDDLDSSNSYHHNNYYTTNANTIFYLVGIAIAVFVIVGAMTYNLWLVAMGILWSVIHAAFYITCVCREYHYDRFYTSSAEMQSDDNVRFPMEQVIVPIVIVGLLNYPQAMFIYEVMAGIMGPETYGERDSYYCCYV